ncbi:putative transcription regulator with HTH domain protein [Calothrix sp. NIES-4071]|nr:putative transcription regulator with HTH domain protein [Calothrix sp. NIES-4071]BAZ64048.1 putative transcription regulator with HTH domain protein [Calothrix sp. NIES-4105]
MSLAFDRNAYGELLAKYQPQVITSESEYESMLADVEKLMGNKNRSPEQTALLKILVRLVEEYESKNYPMGKPSPHAIIQHLMEARELQPADLVGIIGSLDDVSELVNGKKAITKAQAKALGEFFHVSTELFL